jgi:hypothetical protein
MPSSNSGTHRWMVLGLALSALAWLAPSPYVCGQDATPKPSQTKGKWVPLFERHASEYTVRVGRDPNDLAARLPEPVLRWWQPVRGGDDGALYLWVHAGRPVAAVTFFTFKWPNGTRSIVHEKASLVVVPVEAVWRGTPVWSTSQPGLSFKRVPDAPVPAGTGSGRLRQMLAVVRDFSANTIDDKDSKWLLRPLIKPLYRYEGNTDGALFALVQGTDPEAFVLLEARNERDGAHWEYAVARFTDLQIHIRYKGQEVFAGPNTTGRVDGIYHSPTVLSKPGDSPDDFQ